MARMTSDYVTSLREQVTYAPVSRLEWLVDRLESRVKELIYDDGLIIDSIETVLEGHPELHQYTLRTTARSHRLGEG